MSVNCPTPRLAAAGVRALAVLLLVGLAACGKAPQQAGGPGMMPGGPPSVTVAAAIEQAVTETDEFAGRFEATQHVELRARVNGYLQAIHFTPGAEVKAGDLLFEIDPAPFSARLAEAEAAAGNTRAQLDLARLELARQQKMLPERATSRRDFDTAKAGVATSEAALRADEARIRAAAVDLSYTRITAPVAGRMGKDELTIGNLVRGDAPDSPRLSTLVALDPIYVTFEADEAAYLKYIDNDRSTGLKVQVGLGSEEGTPHAATLKFIDNQLDVASGTVRLRAELPNPDRRFTPGLYARVRLARGNGTRAAVLVQDGAIGTDQSKRFVLVLDAKHQAQYREVTPGRAHAGLRVIASGLKAGEKIVVNGLQRVRPGSPVTPEEVPMVPTAAAAKPGAAAQPAGAEAAAPAAPATAGKDAQPVATPAEQAVEVPATPAVEPAQPASAAARPAAVAQSASEPAAPAPQVEPAKPATAADAAPAGDTAPGAAYSAEWLQQQSASHWVLQLAGVVDRAAAETFITRHKLAGKAAILATAHAGKPWFIVVYGLYPNAAKAQEAIASLPPALRPQSPWPRSVKTLSALPG